MLSVPRSLDEYITTDNNADPCVAQHVVMRSTYIVLDTERLLGEYAVFDPYICRERKEGFSEFQAKCSHVATLATLAAAHVYGIP